MKRVFLLVLLASVLATVVADETTGGTANQNIHLESTRPPRPGHLIESPVAEYNTATGALTITLDAVYYSDYVITIEGYYATQDYFPTSSVVVIPAYALSEITHIYIDSDDCGAYEGVLDMNAISSTY